MPMRMKIQGLDEFKRDLDKAVKVFPGICRQAMNKSTQHIKNKVQDKITDEGIPYTGKLQQSIHAKVISDFKGEVRVGAKHGIFVERGTRPHWPPREPIERWARIKLGQPGLGFVISRKIAQVGTKAHKYFEPAVKESITAVSRYFEKTADALIKALAD